MNDTSDNKRADQHMRGWVSVAPGLKGLELYNDLAIPEPGIEEVRLRVEAAGINFSDILMLQDKYQVRPERPFVPGQEIVGIVDAVGPGSQFEIGQKVAAEVKTGGFAEYAVVPESAAFQVPQSFPIAQSAALPVVYGTALVALTESTRIVPGETVLIHAAGGGVGLAAVQVAKAFGATVIATAGTEKKRAAAKQNGADHVVDYTSNAWVDRVRELTAENGVDVVVDTVGGDINVQSIRCLARGGRLMIVGFASGKIPEIPANRLLLKRASAIGVYWNQEKDRNLWAQVKQRIFDMATATLIDPVIDTRYGFEGLPEALAALENRQTIGKLVLADIAGGAG